MLVTVDDEQYDVDYKYWPATRGLRDSLNGVMGAGPPLEPDEPAEIEIVDVTLNGAPVEYDEMLWEKIESEILDELDNSFFYNGD